MFPVLLDFGVHNLPFFGETHLFLPTYGVLYAGDVQGDPRYISAASRTSGWVVSTSSIPRG